MDMIQIGDKQFNPAHVAGVEHVLSPSEITTLLLVGGGSMEFTGTDAEKVWRYFSVSLAEMVL